MTEDSSGGCEHKHIAELSLFGKNIKVKNYLCSKNDCPYKEKPKPLELQLSIIPTFYCGGHCSFCSAASNSGKKGFLDLKKLEIVLKELYSKRALRGISITGGEPFTDIVLLNEIIEMIFDITGIETEISINTNGSALNKLKGIKRLSFVDAIHISRHHYDDDRNRAYFGIDVADADEIRNMAGIVNDPKLFVFNCLLLADGIGNKDEMLKFLEFAGDVGIPKVGFVTPMTINDYTRNNKVSYTEIFDRNDPRMLLTTAFRDYDQCRCQDGVFVTEKGRLVEFYGRETLYGSPEYARGLVYGADNVLRTGFSQDASIVWE